MEERKMKPGAVYIHYGNGKAYQVLHTSAMLAGTSTNDTQEYVVYRSLDDGKVYIRPVESFLGILLDGRVRFREVDLTYLPKGSAT